MIGASLAEKVAAKRDTSGGPDACWPWLGFRDRDGYGNVSTWTPRRIYRAHRVAYEMACGPIVEGAFVLHRCDTPACCNPAHLFIGDHAANMRDREAKGRARHTLGSTHHQSRLTEVAVAEMRERCASGESRRALAREYGISEEAGRKAINGDTWKHVPLRKAAR
jgi:hypothetical protein